jgi:Protein of unknown function (DUF3592)
MMLPRIVSGTATDPANNDTEGRVMSWGEAFNIRIRVFAVLFAVMGPGFLIWMAADTKRQIEGYWWPTAPGVVLSTKPVAWQGDRKSVRFFGRVVYEYTVNGQMFTADLTDLGPGTKRSRIQEALEDVSHYHPGDPVRVYYDPGDPSVGIIENGIPLIHLLLLIGLLAGSVISIVASIFIIRSWLRSTHRAPTPAEPGVSPGPGA